MGEVIPFPEIDYFGGCPKCGRDDGFLNVGREHWFACFKHKTKWHVGSNLFSSWREQSEQEWALNAARLAGYREVEPILNPKYIDEGVNGETWSR